MLNPSLINFSGEAKVFFEETPAAIQDHARPVLRYLSAGFLVSTFRSPSPRMWQATLKPLERVRDKFGLQYEYFMIGNSFDDEFHMRSFDTVPSSKIAFRVDKQLLFVASNASALDDICATRARDNRISIIPLSPHKIEGMLPIEYSNDLDSKLRNSLWVRDRFDDSEPVKTPGEFFGREGLVNSLVQRSLDGKPTAVFGLRKIGKSSILRRVQDRLLGLDNTLVVPALVNCNNSTVKANRWSYLLERLIGEWSAALLTFAKSKGEVIDVPKNSLIKKLNDDKKRISDHGAVSRAFSKDLTKLIRISEHLKDKQKISRYCIIAIFDEADHLYPHLPESSYWQEDYFHLWNTLQGIKRDQEDPRILNYLLGGVNPSGVEMGTLRDQPNPLFEMGTTFVKPMSRIETDELLNGLGYPMGLVFTKDAIDAVFQATGGHPWLLRKVGSLIHDANVNRMGQIEIGVKQVDIILRRSQRKIYAHIDWILRHLERIAKDEYDLLRDICQRGVSSYHSDWKDREFRDVFADHLESYGIFEFDENGSPRVTIKAISNVLARPEADTFDQQKADLKEFVDNLEVVIRYRIGNDLSINRSREEAIQAILEAIPKDAKNRPKSREELRLVGEKRGTEGIIESLNWEDYIVLFSKYREEILWSASAAQSKDIVADLKNTFKTVHIIRHNNDAELKSIINQHGYQTIIGLLANAREFLSD